MHSDIDSVIHTLKVQRTLPDGEILSLLEGGDDAQLSEAAAGVAREQFGRGVWLRGLIEWSNVCRRDCLYCGIRRSNAGVERYTLSREEILSSCERAYGLGLRTFVLQGGENPAAARGLVPIVAEIRSCWPDAAITLGLGELPFDIYVSLRKAGADRFLLRHETATEAHYARLHPAGMTLRSRLECLRELRRLGFQVGMGMMVGSPWQTPRDLLADIRLLEEFRPEMIGIGPFIPHPDTPLGSFPAGSAELTLRLYSILRLILPDALIPSTTALSTIMPGGRKAGILAGANVIMPNFTPLPRREAYALYKGKASTDGAEQLLDIQKELASIGYHIAPGRGDFITH